MTRRHSGGEVIILSFVAAYILTLVPLPSWAVFFRPEWVGLILIYWCLFLPQRIGVVRAWLVGLLMDALTGAVLGQYALALALIAYITLRWHRRLRQQTLWQQTVNVLFLVALMQFLEAWVRGLDSQFMGGWRFWMPAVTSMLLWPWLYAVLSNIQQRFAVH
ncbi:rod shape-determining protein MreD [Nitrosococcus wardiae]|uniref:Rod shape-determining protein MreD n=1 Tax=Nitrosococcus wardiae TaxID=1814290 RepID=A0A4P7BTW2_9GAMM|nr:rod shape-determining protein MreD [Nitrosococcus wardiae]QBQ53301.1 rod shape-determining protein MreD [Nitrosococcus wardiae]